MKISVTGATIKITEPEVIAAGSVNIYKAEFTFNAAWDGLTKVAFFLFRDELHPAVLDEENKCTIPWEAIQTDGWLQIACGGYLGLSKVLTSHYTEPQRIGEGADYESFKPEPSALAEVLMYMAASAQSAAQAAQSAEDARHQPIVGENGNWYTWDGENYVDTGDRAQGDAATIEVGTVTTGAPGSSASINNSGDTNAAIFDFTIPRGDKGETGNTGPQGETGNTGPQGEIGPQGLKGDTGATGNGISSITRTSGTGTPGTTDTYTITYTSGATATFTVTHGTDGVATSKLTGYSKALTSEQLAATDSVLQAFGKLEKRIEDNAQLISQLIEYNKPFHFDHVSQEYLNIDKFWEPFRDGKVYTAEFYHYHISPSSNGVKKDDNEGLICEPSTNTVRGRNDYEKIGLFMSIDVNAYVDENGDYHVIAIDGDGRFQRDGSMGDVYVMTMPGYQKRYSDDNVWGASYSDTMHSGFEILDEAVKPDGTIRPCLLHAKYVAGRNPYENNNLASISGVSPEFVNMSHNGQITEFGKKGSQYSGKTSHDDYYVQLMMWLKYATTDSQSVMKGCENYYAQYTNLVPETGVKRVIITNSQANILLIGSTVSIGDYGESSISVDRNTAQNYNLANRVNIITIEDLGDGNSAVYVDSDNEFDTSLTSTVTTYPWNSGGCDNVLGQDGSPYSNTSGKEPFIINGIEMMVGGHEILQNLIIYNNNTDSDSYKIQVYACYDCTKYSTSPTNNYDLIGYELAQTGQTWKYISKIGIDPSHPSVLVPIEAEASSTTGFASGIFTNTPSTGFRVWPSLGALSFGALCGLRHLHANIALSYANWFFLGRLSATGQSRRRSLG